MVVNRYLRIVSRLAFLLVLLGVSSSLLAQPGDPGVDPDVPITGLEYLIGGGALYGARTLLKRMKKKSD